MNPTNDMFNYLYVIYILTSGAIVSFWIVSLFYKKDLIDRPQITYKASDHYIQEYNEEFDLLETRELTDEFLRSLIELTILEKTPKGEILMFYNHENECFWYYFNKRPGLPSCPYTYLETVAKAYVLKYDCKDIFIEKHAKQSHSLAVKHDKNSVFANLKNYSTKKTLHFANRFSCKGQIKDYKPKEGEISDDFYDINFAAFKVRPQNK
jgi:hypothetical protein